MTRECAIFSGNIDGAYGGGGGTKYAPVLLLPAFFVFANAG